MYIAIVSNPALRFKTAKRDRISKHPLSLRSCITL